MICSVSEMSIDKARKNLANEKQIQISLQTCGISEQLLGTVSQTDYTCGVDCLLYKIQSLAYYYSIL